MPFPLSVNKKILKARLAYAEQAAKDAAAKDSKILTESAEAERTIKHTGYRDSMTNKEIRQHESAKTKQKKLEFLKEFLAESVYQALPLDKDIKLPLKQAIQERVFDYFDSNAAMSMAKTLTHLTNPGARFNFSNISDLRIDEKLVRVFTEKQSLENSYAGLAGDSGRVSFQDFIQIDTFQESVKELSEVEKLNKTISFLVEETSKVIRSKVVAAMKVEAEISQATAFLESGLQTDKMFKLKNKQIVAQSTKNTVFREVYRNVRLFNENAANPSEDNFMAESLLELTLLEACNTLFLEEMSFHERINKLVGVRADYVRKQRA